MKTYYVITEDSGEYSDHISSNLFIALSEETAKSKVDYLIVQQKRAKTACTEYRNAEIEWERFNPRPSPAPFSNDSREWREYNARLTAHNQKYVKFSNELNVSLANKFMINDLRLIGYSEPEYEYNYHGVEVLDEANIPL